MKYIIQQYLNTESTDYKSLINKLLSDNNITCGDKRFLFKDNSGVVLLYPDKPYHYISNIKLMLREIQYKDKFVMSVSGNGYGSGINIMLNIIK